MKTKSNFFLGLGVGLAISFTTFLIVPANSDNEVSNETVINTVNQVADVDPVKGGFITIEEANQLSDAYTAYMQSKGLEGISTGGWIGRSQLRDVSGTFNSDEYIQFKFYKTEGTNGEPQIGLLFYAKQNSTEVMRTGPASFCPVLCDYPE